MGFITFCILSFVSVSSLSAAKECESNWLKYKDNCYYFHNVTETLLGHNRNDSQIVCQNFGGELTSILDKDESNFISSLFKEKWVKQSQHYWIGLNDIKKEGTFAWDDGSAFSNKSFKNWRTSEKEPNNYKNEDCVELSWDGQWNDNKCYFRLGFICKRKIDAVIPISPTLPPVPVVTDAPRTCEAGWIPWGTSCYGLIMGIPKTWEDARADCQRRFGDLVVIEKKEELDFLTNELAKYSSVLRRKEFSGSKQSLLEKPILQYINEYWIGLHDQYNEGRFQWVNGLTINQTVQSWRKKEPSNDFGVENCVEMYGKWAPGEWNDNYCGAIHDYVCEKHSGVHNCPQDWVTYGDYCYQINAHPKQRTDWVTAENRCHDFNKNWESKINVAEAELVSIASEEEQNMLYREFNKMGARLFFWIGLKKKKGNWVWTDRTPFKKQSWQGSSLRQYKCVKNALINEHSGWFSANCNEKHNYVCKVKRGQDRCFDPMGMQNFEIPDSAITTNSQLSFGTPAHAARLYLKAGNTLDGAWCAKNETKKKRPYLQIDFGQTQKLTYMAIQGKSNSKAMVTAFSFKYSLDGISYDTYGDYPPAELYKFLSKVSHRKTNDKVMNLPLPAHLVARYVRIYPIDWHVSCCLRVEFYGCSHSYDNQKCGLGWTEDKATGHCYKFNTQKTSLDAASGLCKAQGAELLSITTLSEKKFIDTQLRTLSGRYSDYWIGLTDLDREGIFQWIDKAPVTLTNWYRSNPKLNDVTKNCVTIRSFDGFWMNVDCTGYRTFICKRKYEHSTVKKKFSNNWRTDADLYWPLEEVKDGKSIGTVEARAYGAYNETYDLPTPFNATHKRHYLYLDGRYKKGNYLEIPGLGKTCASNPDSSSCINGFTLSLLFRYHDRPSAKNKYVLDTLGQRGRSTVGYSVFIKFSRIYVVLRGHEMSYTAYASFKRSIWNHFVFKWSTLDGLKLYINGILKFRRLFGSRNRAYLKREDVTSLFIGRPASTSLFMTKIKLASLAIFNRVLDPHEIVKIYRAELGHCKWGQIAYGSYCYEYNVTALNYMQASASCERRRGSLMSVHSPIEQSFLSMNAGKYGLNADTWIGLNSKYKMNVYNWTDDTPVSYTHWGLAEPNNYRGRLEFCVHTYSGGFWNDNLCFLRKSFVCKYEREILSAVTNLKDKKYTLTLYLYQTRTFGCSLSKKVQLESVLYGSKDCFADKEKAKKLVMDTSCKGPRCVNVRANDNYFKGLKKCGNGIAPLLVITYSCVDDPDFGNTADCPDKYSTCNGNTNACYRLYQDEKTAAEASKICESDGGSLTSIANYYEELFLTTMMSQLYKESDVWIGMTFDNESRTFSWMNGKPITYSNWQNQLPDPRRGAYVKASVLEGADRFLFWKTGNVTEKLPFFCRVLKNGTKELKPRPTKAPSGKCLKGWIRFNDNCYFVNENAMNHVQASAFCGSLSPGANLTSILSPEENRFLFKEAGKQEKQWFTVWIGLTNEAITKGYHWLDYEPLKFINWNSNTPYTGPRHMCVGMNTGGFWWDLPCHTRYPSICKVKPGDFKKPTPTPKQGGKRPEVSKCERGWKYYNGSCYLFSKQALDFYQARQNCSNMSSHLVSIRDKGENKFIADQLVGPLGSRERRQLWPNIRSQISGKYTTSTFIGLHDQSEENGWEWTDGSLVIYKNWQAKQPDNWHGEEDCVRMRTGGKWDDISCSLSFKYVCKKNNDTVIKPTEKPVADTGYCSDGWVLYGNKCYLFKYGPNDRRKQKDAKLYCRQFDNGDLASIHNSYENAFLLSQLEDAPISVYIGFQDYLKEGTFVWTDQSSVTYTNWHVRQPSRYRNEDCVEMFPFYLYRGRWNDIHCGKELGFICQQNSYPGTKPTSPKPQPNPCPSGYEMYKEDCYAVFTKKLSWENARKACLKDTADLVSFHDPFRQAFVYSRFVQQTYSTWIGLRKDADDAELRWSDKTNLDYHHWYNGRMAPKTNGSNCVAQIFKYDGRWVSDKCDIELSYACKITRVKPVVETKETLACAEGWTQNSNMCYKYFERERASWPEAREKCKRFGGDLATIRSKKIQDVIYYLVRSSFTSVWIGLNDREQEHVWKWSSGESLSERDYDNWGEVEPNDSSGSENCVELKTANGKWNDISCTMEHQYVCEHSLECKKPLGMENGTILNSALTASNFTGEYFPRYARLRARSDKRETAWCTGITDGKQNLTINLGDLTHVTLIQTQGLFPYRVISYRLFYSDDGENWKSYTEETGPNAAPRIMPGNDLANSIEGVTVDLHAVFVRFMPTLFKMFYNYNLVCLRVELFGCKSVCKKGLGLADYSIPSLTVSSTLNEDTTATSVRIAASETHQWCAKAVETDPWIRIDFMHGMKITRVLAYGNNTESFTMQLSNDGKNFRQYQEYNATKIFSTKKRVHDLDQPAVTRFLKVLPKGRGSVCLKLEVYGCEFDCDIPVGLESKRLGDDLITASSAHGEHVGSKARLGAPSNDYWRPNVDDKKQYLQFDFTQTARITGVATQGCGDNEMFVKSYFVQWSNDGIFWQRSDDEIYGNHDADNVEKVKLKNSIPARYLRINPVTWNINICLRVELYGCPIKKFKIPAQPRKTVIQASLRLTDMVYDKKLAFHSSQEFKALQAKILKSVKDVYTKDENFKNGAVEVIINEFRPGSVVADFTVIVTDEDGMADASEVLRKEIATGTVGDLKVDKTLSGVGKDRKGSKPDVTSRPAAVTPPNSHKFILNALLFLSEEKFTKELENPSSQGYAAMLTRVKTAIKGVFANDPNFKDDVVDVAAAVFRNGSVIVDATLIVSSKNVIASDPIAVLRKQINTGRVGEFKVDAGQSDVYGKSKVLTPKSTPASTIPRHKQVFFGMLRLTEEAYNDNLQNESSAEYLALEKKVQSNVKDVYMLHEDYRGAQVEVIINGFSAGSVLVDFTVIILNAYDKQSVNPSHFMKDTIKTGMVGSLAVDNAYSSYVKAIKIVNTAMIRDESGLSERGKIGLLVFFFLLIAGVLITGVVFYLRRSKRGFKLQFAHKSFENPVHMGFTNDDEHADHVHILNSQD